MSLDTPSLTKSSRPILACLDKHCAPDTTANTQEDENQKLECMPIRGITNLEQDNFVGAVWVEELERERSDDTAE